MYIPNLAKLIWDQQQLFLSGQCEKLGVLQTAHNTSPNSDFSHDSVKTFSDDNIT